MQYLVKEYIQLKIKFKDRGIYISFLLRATYIQSALTVSKYYENMRPNKHTESPKKNLWEPFL
jgi:hypothetical protein